MNKPIRSLKNKKQVTEQRVASKKSDDSYYVKYKKEKRERKRLQNVVGQIDNQIKKVNRENEEIFTQMQIAVDYWKFSFFLAQNHGVDFLNYEIGLLEKGLLQTEIEETKKDE